MDVTPPIVELKNVSKRFEASRGDLLALDNVNLNVQQGEVVSIIGPSGCGKTTTLRLVAGLEKPSAGEVHQDGKPIIGPDRRRGIVAQSYSVFPWLTARENIGFGIRQLPAEIRTDRVNRWLHRVRLMEFADAFPRSLSGGMQQRVALARTMIVEPEVVLLDESLGQLDEHTRADMQDLLQDVFVEVRCAALIVTHSIREAIRLSNRICLMSNRPGKILQTFVVPEPFPRHRDFPRSPSFNQLYDSILEQLPS